MKNESQLETVLVTGDCKLSFSIAVCMIQSGYKVILFTPDQALAENCISKHIRNLEIAGKKVSTALLAITTNLTPIPNCKLAISLTDEKLADKKVIIEELEQHLPKSTLIAVNTESIALADIQEKATCPERIIGLNWVEPAYTTFFLEIITNKINDSSRIESLKQEAKKYWNKDPYVVFGALSIKSRLFSAMAREAFFLIENGYATVQDIDRACRNDAGYYLPFAGNFRYMDLMGTHSYAEVMKKLNVELATDSQPPKLLEEIIEQGGLGMENNKGFYSYKNGDTSDWEKLFANFSIKIQALIRKYPFKYEENLPFTNNKFHG